MENDKAWVVRYLFVHQNFPGQYLHILKHLHEQGGNEIVFISSGGRQDSFPGVKRVLYQAPPPPSEGVHPYLREFDHALRRAEGVSRVAKTIRDLGYAPDIIIGHHGWGELLHLVDVFPSVPILGYFEYFYHSDRNDVGFDPEFPLGPDLASMVRAKNAVNYQALDLPGHGQTPTRFQRDTYPLWAREKISLLKEGVDLEVCRPDRKVKRRELTIGDVRIGPNEKLVTYVARDLEPYRGFHSVMRALPSLLRERPDVRVILVGRDGVSYGTPPASGGTWREKMLEELGGTIDPDRVHFVGRIPYGDFVRLLQRSDVHLYLTYPFVASWSLREALAMGCTLVGSDTAPVREFLTDGVTGRLAPFLEPERIAATVLELLEDEAQAAELGKKARLWAQENLCLKNYLKDYDGLIGKVVDG